MDILKTNNLTKIYGNLRALNNVNIHIKKGEIYGLIGENGSGKSTFIKLVTNLILPTSGSFKLFDKKKVGAIVESPALYLNLSAKNNLIIQGTIVGVEDTKKMDDLLDLVGLGGLKENKKKVKDFSLGMKQRLSIAMCLLNDPEFILLDEPMNGLDPEGIIGIRNLILELNQNNGITFLISSHLLEELSKVATKYGFLYHGALINEATKEEILNSLTSATILELEGRNYVEVLKELNITDYSTTGNRVILYGDIDIPKLTLELAKENIQIKNLFKRESSIEEYYIRLMEASREKINQS